MGSILREGKGRVVSLGSDLSRTIVGCHGTDNTIELLYFLPDDEVKVKMAKRLNKQKLKYVEM